MQKKSKINEFRVWCSEIDGLYSMPKGVNFPSNTDTARYQKLLNSEKEKTPEQIDFIKKYDEKVALYNNPPLSKTTINGLIRQYGWMVYNKKTAPSGDPLSFIKKGNDMEQEAVELLSKIDNLEYKLQTETVQNDYLIGRCDVLCPNKVIDIKISWNVNSFLKAKEKGISRDHWYQMQGYMELYNVDEAEVVFLLLNTPAELIEREKIKLANRFMIGEIDRDKYELDMANIESSFTYSNIHIKKRYFRYKIKREKSIIPDVYKRVLKARKWVRQFDKEMKITVFDVPSDKFLNAKKDNTESDT